MPGPHNPPRPPAFAHHTLFSARKVRVVCADPDATDSSSGDDDAFLPKRLVREISMPPTFSFRFQDASSQFVSMAKPCSRKRQTHFSLPSKKPSVSRAKGIRQRSCGKWVAGHCKAAEQPINGRHARSSSCCNSALMPEQVVSRTHESFSLRQASAKDCRTNSVTSSTSAEAEKSSAFEKDVHTKHSLVDRMLPSVNDTGSSRCMGEDKDELFRLCSDMESVKQCPLMISPSSASESAVCTSSALPASGEVSDKVSSDARSDEGSTGSVSSLTNIVAEHCNTPHVNVAADSSQPTMAPGAKPDDASILSPLLDELPTFFDFGQMLDFEGSGNCVTGEDIPHMADPFDEFLTDGGEFLTGGGEFDGMSFDFDSEALAWINVPEVCAV